MDKPTSREEIRTTWVEGRVILIDMEPISQDLMLKGMYDRDRSADGRYLVGVRTTGIYCLPSCPARKPKAENVRFFLAEEDARRAGLRACKRCRPSSFYRDFDPDYEAVVALATEIRLDPCKFAGVPDLARELGLGVTKVHELFRNHFHRTPAEFLARARVEKACILLNLHESNVSDVAFAVGFESLAPFHAHIRRRTGLTPGEHRRIGESDSFTIRLPAGYLHDVTRRVLGRDSNSVIERVEAGRFTRALLLEDTPALLHMNIERESVDCQVESPQKITPPMMGLAHRRAVRLLGLGCEPGPFERRVLNSPELAPLVASRRGLRIPLTVDVFESLTWAILGQQVNLAFAFSLQRRLAELCGVAVGTSGLFAHPTPEAIAHLEVADLLPLQFSRSKADYLIGVARKVVERELDVEQFPQSPIRKVERALRATRGFGPWSTHYVMMRGCGFADCVPAGDSGLSTALLKFFRLDERPDASGTLTAMAPFAPDRSLASFHLWMSLKNEEPI